MIATIQQGEQKDKRRPTKGRVVSAEVLCYVRADGLWSGGETDTDTIRPVYLAVAGNVGEIGPFVANLRGGKRASLGEQGYSRRKPPSIETLKSADYTWAIQRHPEGVVAQAFLRDLVQLDVGLVDPAGIKFVLLPPGCGTSGEHSGSSDEPNATDLENIARLAPYFAAWVDRRTRAPILPDAGFHRLLLERCLDARLAGFSYAPAYGCDRWGRSRRLGFFEVSTDRIGLGPGLAMHATHEDFEEVLADAVAEHFDSKRSGKKAA